LEGRGIVIEAERKDVRKRRISLDEDIFWKNNVVTSNLNAISFEQLKTKIEPHRGTIRIPVVVNGVDGSVGPKRRSSGGSGVILGILCLLARGIMRLLDGGNRGVLARTGQRGRRC
jgi:hypothetical protein